MRRQWIDGRPEETYITAVPDTRVHRIGFRNARVSQTIIMGTICYTLGLKLFMSRYSTRFHICYPMDSYLLVVARALISTVCLDSVWDLFGHLFLLYCFRSVERHWGSAKFVVFLVWTHCASIIILTSWLGFLRSNDEVKCLPGGLIGPLFAMAMTQHDKHSHEGLFTTSFTSIVLSKKFLITFTCLQILTVSQSTIVYGAIGTALGALHWEQILSLQLLGVPRFLRDRFNEHFDFQKSSHRACFMGATPAIHDDILYDYTSRFQRWPSAHSQSQVPSTRNSADATRVADLSPGNSDILSVDSMVTNASVSSSAGVEITEDKINALSDMGFSRTAVIQALQQSNSNVQIATEVLVSRHSN